LAGSLLFNEIICQSAALFFGLELKIFYSWVVLQKRIVDSPAFLEPCLAARLRFVPIQPIREELGGLDGFLYEAAQKFSNIQD
jgi:hypothetical protein